MSDSTGATLGTISGIMSGIQTESTIALKIGPDMPNPENYYRAALTKILQEATRAEKAWEDHQTAVAVMHHNENRGGDI